jgi:hypothetical protein
LTCPDSKYEGVILLKLYRLSELRQEYWEIWETRDGTQIVHWRELGTKGQSKEITATTAEAAREAMQVQIDLVTKRGFAVNEGFVVLIIEYQIDGMGNTADLEKRHRLQDRLDETLGCTGLRACDGGSTGGGTMEVCNFVVDFEIAKSVIEDDVANTEFSDYTRIYVEQG